MIFTDNINCSIIKVTILNDGKKLTVDEMNIECDVPKRSGYQIILGIWTIADTGSAFYQVIDVNISDI